MMISSKWMQEPESKSGGIVWMHQTILQKLAQNNSKRNEDCAWSRLFNLLISEGSFLFNLLVTQDSQCDFEPIAEPKMDIFPSEIQMISGSKCWKELVQPDAEITSHFWRLEKSPRCGPSVFTIFQALKTSSDFPNRLPSSIYQLFKAKSGTLSINLSIST